MSWLLGMVAAAVVLRWGRKSMAAAPRLVGVEPEVPDLRFRWPLSGRTVPPEGLAEEIVATTDLLMVAVRSGLNVHLAVEAVAPWAGGLMRPELNQVVQDVSRGVRLGDALDGLVDRLGDPVRPLAAALAASERYGDPLGPSLERLAGEQRDANRRTAEAAARRLPIKLLFPLVTCILPAFTLLTVAPLIAGALRALRL